MLVHTKSFGAFFGNENVISRHNNYTDVNNLSKYAVTKRIYVKVLDREGVPLNDALVEYQLYNYAEFYPLAVVPTNKNGISQFETGLGDLLIWAYKDDNFDFKKISVSETDTLILNLNGNAKGTNSFDLDLNVPVICSPIPGPSLKIIEQNSERINKENIIRQKYIDSWMKPAEAKALALALNIDTTRVMTIIARSMGNYNEISSFLSEKTDSLRMLALSMLEILPDKDLRDIKGSILSDHLRYSIHPINLIGESGNKMFLQYILNPRVANESIVSWRNYFRTNLPSQLLEKALYDPLLIIQYLNDNIRIKVDQHDLSPEEMCPSIIWIKTGTMFILLMRNNLIRIKGTLDCNQVKQNPFLNIIFISPLQDSKVAGIIHWNMIIIKRLMILKKKFHFLLETICLLQGTD